MTANSLEAIEVIPTGKALDAQVKGLDLAQASALFGPSLGFPVELHC